VDTIFTTAMLTFPCCFQHSKWGGEALKTFFFFCCSTGSTVTLLPHLFLCYIYIYVYVFLSYQLQTSCICCCSRLVPLTSQSLQTQNTQQLLLIFFNVCTVHLVYSFYFNQQCKSTHHPSTQATSTQEYVDCIYGHVNILLIHINLM